MAEDIEKARERRRRYRDSHRDEIREKNREFTRAYYAANREEILQKKRGKGPQEYTDERREYNRRYHAANRERLYQQSKRTVSRRALLSQLWAQQGGLCYLCEEPVALDKAVLEHDHRCCPATQFCRHCARGAAHQRCNTIVGYVNDDVEQLERIARNLRLRSDEVTRVLESRPQQPVFRGMEV